MAGLGPPRGGMMRPLMLDLSFLPRDGPASTTPDYDELRRQKFAKFEMQCSKVADGLYVSGAAVAQDRAILAAHGITHIVNCVGALYPEYFKDDGVVYKTLWLQDTPHEDITCVLYDTFDFIEDARVGSNNSISAAAPAAGSDGYGIIAAQRQHSLQVAASQLQLQQLPGCELGSSPSPQQPHHQQPECSAAECGTAASAAVVAASSASKARAAAGGYGSSSGAGAGGRVLVHCSQGVSRSTTIAIAYLMWKTGCSYDEVYQAVRTLRGVTSPNVGFMCQLINWAKRRQRPPGGARIYRIAPHSPDNAMYLVPKPVNPKPGCSHADWTALDSRGCFVVHLPHSLYVWRGRDCIGGMADAGWRAAAALVRYEGAPQPQLVRQGEEPVDFLAALDPGSSTNSGSAQTAGSLLPSVEPSTASLAGGPAAAGGGSQPSSVQQHHQQQPPPPATVQQRQQQQQRQPPPWLAAPSSSGGGGGQLSSSALAGSSSSSRAGNAMLQQQQGEADLLSLQLSSNVQLASRLLGVVGEVDEFSADYETWLRALLKSGGSGSAEAGRLTPRGSLVGLAVDDIGTGGSSSGRSESPATTEGRNRKYRRSETDSMRSVIQSFRQPGRLSTSSNPSLWPGAATAAAAAAAAAAGAPPDAEMSTQLTLGSLAVSSSSSQSLPVLMLGGACSGMRQIGDIKRMSIDEGGDG
ncbi:hypothetical protein COO60DRAFT_1699341 [Scenedesmus sp. NREL 46B-D3]|nr:hypothetical protein COO60DRAFT_1699341 [Scenedesmus sp. NREL 46B-D3]